MGIHVHIHIHREDETEIKNLLVQLLKKVTMSQEILAELQSKVDAANTSLTNIRADIQKIKDTLPAEGGLTADEVASLRTSLDSLASGAAALDAENE